MENYVKGRVKKLSKKAFIGAVGFLAVCFLIMEIISATAGGVIALLAWNQTQCQDQTSDEDYGGDIKVGAYDKNLVSMAKAVADAVGDKLGINPKWIFGQKYQETGFNANASTALKDNNLGGVKWSPAISKYATRGGSVGDNTGGVYAHFKTLDGYATVYAQTLKNMLGGKKPKTIEEFVDILASKHYFGSYHGETFYASAEEKQAYVNGIKAGMKLYDSAKTSKSAKVKNMAYQPVKRDAWKKKIKLPNLNSLIVDVDNPESGRTSSHGKLAEGTVEYIPSGKSSITANNFTKLENMDGEGDSNGGTRDFRTHGDDSDKAWGEDIKKNTYAGSKEIDASIKEAITNGQKWSNDNLGTKFNTGEATKTLKRAKDEAQSAQDEAKSADKKVKDTEQKDHDEMVAECVADGDSESSVSGKWMMPFKEITGKPKYLDGGQFGNSAGSVGTRGTSFHDGFDFSNGMNDVHTGSSVVRAVTGGTIYKVAFTDTRKDYHASSSTKSSNNAWWFVWEKAQGYNIIYQEAFVSKSDISVKEGQHVKAGDKIGTLTGTHLHLGMNKRNISISVQGGSSAGNGWEDPIKVIMNGMTNGGGSSLKLSATDDEARKWIVNRESSGSYTARNGKYYGAYQLDISYLRNKTYGGDGSLSKKNQDYVAQKYMEDRYGTWKKAEAFWRTNNWW